MRSRSRSKTTKQDDAGVALLIAIFALMLISVVAIALVVSTGTDSALAGNYRTASGAYYAAVAGLEEARGRLLWKNADFFNKTGTYSNIVFDSSGVLPAWGLTTVLYITNGVGVDPTSSNPAAYPDTEYNQEFPSWGLSGATVYQIASVSSTNSQSLPGPSYKWVRINPLSEQSLNIDVNGNGFLEGTALFYDPAHLGPLNNSAPSLVVPPMPSVPPAPPTSTSLQALEITAYAVLPNGSTRLLQYVVAPYVVAPFVQSPPDLGDVNFPAALTLDGNNVAFQGGSNFAIHGDESTTSTPPGCTNSTQHAAIGYTNPSDSSLTNINGGATPAGNYTGNSPNNIANVNNLPSHQTAFPLSQSWQTPSGLDSVIQAITQAADVVVNGPATQTIMPATMSPTNPMTIVVNGDLTFNSWHGTGYGILVVTGTFNYDPDATWNGIVLVVGQGKFVSTRGGTGSFNGAVLVAQTRDSSGNLLPDPNLGTPSFTETGGGGINYSSCWVSQALGAYQGTVAGPIKYEVLSFREIPTS